MSPLGSFNGKRGKAGASGGIPSIPDRTPPRSGRWWFDSITQHCERVVGGHWRIALAPGGELADR